MSIISFGVLDKKLIILVLMIIADIIHNIIKEKCEDYLEQRYLGSLEEEVAPLIAAIIMNFTIKQKQVENKQNKKNIKYPIFLFLFRLAKSCYEKIYPYINKKEIYRYNAILNTTNGVEIFLMTLGTILLLNYKYYTHHVISMVSFCILGIINDFILGSYFTIKYNYIYIYIIYILNEVFLYCYIKYMMDKLYYHYIEILLYWGITGILVKLIIFSGFVIYEETNDIEESIIKNLHKYFIETNVLGIIFLQFLYYLVYYAIYNILLILLLYYLRPNHMIISDEITVFLRLIFFQDKPNKYYTIIGFVLQIFALLFYFEILELNFWNLNNNTAKNIQIREGNDNNGRLSSVIELGDKGDYYMKQKEVKENNNEEVVDEDENIIET